MFNYNNVVNIMNVRFRFKCAKLALECKGKLPIGVKSRIVTDRTTDVYLEIPEDYESYFNRYLYTPYDEQILCCGLDKRV